MTSHRLLAKEVLVAVAASEDLGTQLLFHYFYCGFRGSVDWSSGCHLQYSFTEPLFVPGSAMVS
jgi:hypothetical protein